MNATDFIKHYGLNTAIRIIEDSKNDDFWDTETAFYTDKNSESCVCLSELKRLVASVDLINANGGLNGTKNTVKLFQSSLDIGLYHGVDGVDAEKEIPRLKQAIADYESIYSIPKSVRQAILNLEMHL